MTLTDMAAIANNYTDENLDTLVLLAYANSAISKINIKVKANLPMIENSADPYTGLDDTWIYAIIIPHMCWSIKMNDSSLNEANTYLYQVQEGLMEIKKNKMDAIPEEFQKDSFQTKFVITNAVDYQASEDEDGTDVYNPYSGD